MKYLDIEQENESVQAFVKSLAAYHDESVIQWNGTPLLRVFPADADRQEEHAAFLSRTRELLEQARKNSPRMSAKDVEKKVNAAVDRVRATRKR
jgi:hypothetical protein